MRRRDRHSNSSKNKPEGSGGAQSLHALARNGDIKALQMLFFSDPSSINARDNHSRTPLHLAAWAGQTEAVEFLCNQKADVRATAVDNMSAIHFASQKGHLEIVRILLRSGANVNATTRKGMTPLHYAVQGGHKELIKFLVLKRASLHAETNAGKTPFDLTENEEVRQILKSSEQNSKKEKKKETELLSTDVQSSKAGDGDLGGTSTENTEKTLQNDIADVHREDQTTETSKSLTSLQSCKNGNNDIEGISTDNDAKALQNDVADVHREDETAGTGRPPKKAKVALSHLVDDENLDES